MRTETIGDLDIWSCNFFEYLIPFYLQVSLQTYLSRTGVKPKLISLYIVIIKSGKILKSIFSFHIVSCANRTVLKIMSVFLFNFRRTCLILTMKIQNSIYVDIKQWVLERASTRFTCNTETLMNQMVISLLRNNPASCTQNVRSFYTFMSMK